MIRKNYVILFIRIPFEKQCEFGIRWTTGYSADREGMVYRFPEVPPMDIDHESEQAPQDTDAYRSPQDAMRRVAEQMRQTAREMRKGVVQTREAMHTMRDRLRRQQRQCVPKN